MTATLRAFRCTACGEYALSTGELGGEAHVRSSPVLEAVALGSLCSTLPEDLYRMGAAGAVVVQGAALCGDGRGRWIEVGAGGKEHDDELYGPVTEEARAETEEAAARVAKSEVERRKLERLRGRRAFLATPLGKWHFTHPNCPPDHAHPWSRCGVAEARSPARCFTFEPDEATSLHEVCAECLELWP